MAVRENTRDMDVYRDMWEEMATRQDWPDFDSIGLTDDTPWWDPDLPWANVQNRAPTPMPTAFFDNLPPRRHPSPRFTPSSITRSRNSRPQSPRMGTGASSQSANHAHIHYHPSPEHRYESHSGHERRPRSPHTHDAEDYRRESNTGHVSSPLFGNLDDEQDFPSTSSNYGPAIDIDDILGVDFPPTRAGNMPARRQNSPRAHHNTVDLTISPPASASASRHPTARKRSAHNTIDLPVTKKRRTSLFGDESAEEKENTIEHLDLTNEAPSAEEELLQAQQAELLAAQQSSNEGPLKIGKRTCIICMDAYTNATVTQCGHMYCHECLTQALRAGEKASEKGVGNCPVCRKPVKRNTKTNQMIPVAFMKKSTYQGKARGDHMFL